MKVGVVGSRNFTDRDLMADALGAGLANEGYVTVVSGGADGADTMARNWALDTESEVLEYFPDRAKYGWPKAAFERNTLIANDSDVLYVFFGPGEPPIRGDRSFGSGSMDTVQKAMALGIPVHMYFQKED